MMSETVPIAARDDGLSPKLQRQAVARTATGEFEALYEQYYGRVFNYVARTAMNRHAAEDITGETFLRAYRGFSSYSPDRAPFSSWIYAIATNQLRSHFRKNRHDAAPEPDSALEQLLVQDGRGDPASQLDKLERFRRLHASIARLKPIYRIVITLHYFEGYALKEVAGILGEMAATVRWRLYRARTLLEKDLTSSRGDLS